MTRSASRCNIISGLVGGGVLGQIVTLLLPAITAAAQSGDLSIGGIISQAIAGGAGGAYSLRSLAQSRTKLLPRTIQVWPKDLPAALRQVERAVHRPTASRREEYRSILPCVIGW